MDSSVTAKGWKLCWKVKWKRTGAEYGSHALPWAIESTVWKSWLHSIIVFIKEASTFTYVLIVRTWSPSCHWKVSACNFCSNMHFLKEPVVLEALNIVSLWVSSSFAILFFIHLSSLISFTSKTLCVSVSQKWSYKMFSSYNIQFALPNEVSTCSSYTVGEFYMSYILRMEWKPWKRWSTTTLLIKQELNIGTM